jgi:hypothetical protein
MAKQPMVLIFEVTEGFVCPAGSFHAGQLVWADDPIVAQHPANFRAAKVTSTVPREARVEQATAAPGEKRGR